MSRASDLHQTILFGQAMLQLIKKMNIFILNLNQLGLQIAKNIILSNPKLITLYDQKLLQQKDTFRSLYFKKEDIGKKRSDASFDFLQPINELVQVKISETALPEQIAQNYDVVIATDCWDLQYLIKLNRETHKRGKGFIMVSNITLFGYIFVDFGDDHTIKNQAGHFQVKGTIQGITRSQEGILSLYQNPYLKHQFKNGDIISIHNVKGMSEINGKVYQVKKLSSHALQIGDTSEFSEYISGGVAISIQKQKSVGFTNLQQNLTTFSSTPVKSNEEIASSKILSQQNYVILQTFFEFYRQHKTLPRLSNKEDNSMIISIAEQISKNRRIVLSQDFHLILKRLAFNCDCQILPFSSIWAGIATQQALKFVGLYSPINQWFCFDYLNLLEEKPNIIKSLSTYELLLGQEVILKISKSKAIMIGAGSIGCEFLRILSDMGFSSKNGSIKLYDDEQITPYNANRISLTHKKDIGQSKARILSQNIKRINEQMNIEPITLKINHKNKGRIPFESWDQQDFIISTANNRNSNEIIDQHCISHDKIMLECMARGSNCSTTVVIPNQTLSYSEAAKQSERQTIYMDFAKINRLPFCAEQVVSYSKSKLQYILKENEQLLQFYQNKTNFLEKFSKDKVNQWTKLEYLSNLLVNYGFFCDASFKKCVILAMWQFYNQFQHKVQKLLQSFPCNHLLEDKELFWSKLRTLPTIIKIDFEDPIHRLFIYSVANIYSDMFEIPAENQETVIEIAKSLQFQQYSSNHNNFCEENIRKQEKQLQEFNNQLSHKIASLELGRPKTKLLQFTSNNPKQIHISFIYSMTILRCRNYQIQELQRSHVQSLACRIIPKVITGASISAGLLGMELLKLLLGKGKEFIKNNKFDLTVSKLTQKSLENASLTEDYQYDQIMCGPVKVIPHSFTLWQKIKVKGPLTGGQLKQLLQTRFKVQIILMSMSTSTFYSIYGRRQAENLDLQISQIYVKKYPNEKEEHFIDIYVAAVSQQIDCIIPTIRYYI